MEIAEEIELDLLLVLDVPEGEVLQPDGDLGIFGHVGKGQALGFILPALAAE